MTDEELHAKLQEMMETLTNDGHSEDEEPSLIIDWLVHNNTRFESAIKKSLDVFSAAQEVGQWARSVMGVGPVIASGMLAHIDMDKTPSIGALWRFAGYDPTSQWLGKEKAEALLKLSLIHI